MLNISVNGHFIDKSYCVKLISDIKEITDWLLIRGNHGEWGTEALHVWAIKYVGLVCLNIL